MEAAAVGEGAEGAEARDMKLGVGYRRELRDWLASRPPGVDCLELTAEHFHGPLADPLPGVGLAGRNPGAAPWPPAPLAPLAPPAPPGAASPPNDCLFVHGLGLSLGTPGPLDKQRLREFARLATAVNAAWVSEHVAFTRTAETDLGHLNAVPPTRPALKVMAAHAREVADHCGRPLLLENITSHVQLHGELSETQFLNELCEQAECGLLLDVTNLFVNSRNHRFDPLSWLQELDPARIRQLHLVGYSCHNGRYMDDHAQPIQPELLDLARAVIAYAPVEAIILERDADFPGVEGMDAEIAKLETLRAAP